MSSTLPTSHVRQGRGAGLALTAVLLAPAVAFAAPPEYRAARCHGDYAGIAQTVTCGTLVIDETRGSNNGRRVALPVAVVKALKPHAGAVPVIYLHGGPGGGAIDGLPDALRAARGTELYGQDQDWIFFDQRGGILSTPSLDCGPSLPLNDAGPLSEAAARGLIACGARHAAAGVDLSAYNALEVARDVQDLRTALGLERFDLFGVSYGTRIAFSVLRAHAAGVRAVVLDSVWPPEATWAEGGPKNLADAAHLVLAQCAATRACRARFPHAPMELAAFATRLLAGPVTVKDRTYTAEDLGGFLMDRLYDGDGARSLPRDAHAFSRGDYSALDAQIAARSQYLEAQHLAFLCKEEFPFERRDHVADGIGSDAIGLVSVKGFQRYFDVCASFPVGAPDPMESQPVTSDLPTLFLSAQFDPGCPPLLQETASKRFARSQFVLVPNTTHGVFRVSPCGRQMIRAFLADPTHPVDRACLSANPDRFDFALK